MLFSALYFQFSELLLIIRQYIIQYESLQNYQHPINASSRSIQQAVPRPPGFV